MVEEDPTIESLRADVARLTEMVNERGTNTAFYMNKFNAAERDLEAARGALERLVEQSGNMQSNCCERALNEEEMDLEENFDRCETCAPLRDAYENAVAFLAPPKPEGEDG